MDCDPREPPAAQALALLADPALDLAFLSPSRVGVPSAWYGHVPFAHWLVGAAAPRLIVELGTHNGVSYAAFCEAVAQTGATARCVAIDTWQGDEHAGHYDETSVYDDLRKFHDPRYAGFSTLMRSTFDEARPSFADGSIDLLHIDGLHTYDAVRRDWEAWRPALSARAIVLFHDVAERQPGFGVWQLWEELQAAFPSFTFPHAHGLGVLSAGTEPPACMQRLCAMGADPDATQRIRARFSRLGERWVAHFRQLDSLAQRTAAERRIATLQDERARLDYELARRDGELAQLRAALVTPASPRSS